MSPYPSRKRLKMHNLESNMQNIKSEVVHLNKLFGYQNALNQNCSVACVENTHIAMRVNGELNATLENQSKILERASENITKIQERFLVPTKQFSAYGVVNISPRKNQTIVYHNVTVNIGHGYNATDSVFTAPANGTYLFSMQVCTTKNNWGWFQLVVSDHSGRHFSIVTLQ